MAGIPYHLRKFAFKNRQDAHDRAKPFNVCMDCLHNQPELYKKCPKCGSKNRERFPSEVEFKRGMVLIMLRDKGHIKNLRFHNRFKLEVNGVHITNYEPDADYIDVLTGAWIVEDSKFKGDPKFIEPHSRDKMRLFKAVYGVEVQVPQHQKPAVSSTQKEMPL